MGFFGGLLIAQWQFLIIFVGFFLWFWVRFQLLEGLAPQGSGGILLSFNGIVIVIINSSVIYWRRRLKQYVSHGVAARSCVGEENQPQNKTKWDNEREKKNREREEREIERERAEENKLNENEEGKWHPRSARCPAVSSSLETGKNPPHRSGIPLLFISEFYIFLFPKSCTHPLTKSKKR